MRRALTVLVSICLLPACYGSHGSRRDARVVPDAGTPDDGVPDARPVDTGVLSDAGSDCGTLAGYSRCGFQCSDDTLEAARCPEGLRCLFENEFCTDGSAPEDSRGSPDCGRFRDGGWAPNYCWRGGQFCLVNTELDRYGGPCVNESLCRALLETGDRQQCIYSDTTFYADGPPYPSTCPPAPDPEGTFCGGPCGECPAPDYPTWFGGNGEKISSCVGLSESRGLGICTIIGPGASRPDAEFAGPAYQELGRPLAFLVRTDPDSPDGVATRGYFTFASSCRAYVSRFPDGVYTCLDLDWTPLP